MSAILPLGKTTYTDASGAPLNGGSVYFYSPGTTTPKTTYSDQGLTTPNADPVVLDSRGQATIWGSGSYRQLVKDSSGVTIWDVVVGTELGAASLTAPVTIESNPTSSWTPPTQAATVTYSAFRVISTTAHAASREFAASVELTNNTGVAHIADVTGDKVTLYLGHDMKTGAGNGWIANFNYVIEAGATTQTMTGLEMDCNNNSAHRDGGGVVSGGVGVTGAGTKRNTYAFSTGGPGTAGTEQFYNGLQFGNYSVYGISVLDQTHSGTFLLDQGTHNVALDCTGGTYAVAPIYLPNNSYMLWKDQAGTSTIGIGATTANALQIAGSTLSAVTVGAPIKPTADNLYSVGASGLRFTAFWGVNGAIQASDPSLKTDIAPLPVGMLDVVAAIDPITFRWKIGGVTTEMRPVEVRRQVTTTRTVEEDAVDMVAGVATLVRRPRIISEPAWDDVPVVNPDGTPAMVTIKGKRGRPDRTIQRTHRVARMETVIEMQPVQVERPGQRTHWGWNAEQVRDAFASLGVDFGGFVRGDDGTLHLRPDQLVPVLWAAVRELAARATP